MGVYMSRLDKVWMTYIESLKKKSHMKSSYIKETFQESDPDGNGKHLRWIIDNYLRGHIALYEIIGSHESVVYKSIDVFIKNRHRLEEKKRSIFSYKSPHEINSLFNDDIKILSTNQLKKHMRNNAHVDTKFITPGLMNIDLEQWPEGVDVISPTTKESSCWWGRKTKWCTSSVQSHNMFDYYNSRAPLYIIMFEDYNGDKRKWQLWKHNENVIFKNEQDKIVSLSDIKKNWHMIGHFALWTNDIRFIPERYLTSQVCKNILNEHPEDIDFLSIYM